MEDRGGAYLLRMEFPRRMPVIGLPDRLQLPDEMPDYDYDLALKNGQFIIKGKCTDERVRKISSSIGAFPPEFTTSSPLVERVLGFAHHFDNKLLQVFLLTAKDSRWGESCRSARSQISLHERATGSKYILWFSCVRSSSVLQTYAH